MNPNQFSYPKVDFENYSSNFIGKCMVSHYEDACGTRIHIVDMDRPFDFDLTDEIVSPLAYFPAAGEVFALDLDVDGIYRVVCNANVLNKSLFFIDCGEVMEVSGAELKMFSLSDRAKKAAARAIPCFVVEMLDEHDNPINDVAELLHEEVSFTVIENEGDKLIVTLSKKIACDANEPIGLAKQKANGVELTQEEHDMLYEEPEMSTTNAMKAVIGYEPQDDRRICPHYDPMTGGCFKGNQCRFEHIAKMEDGWTHDRKACKTKLDIDVVPVVGSTVKVCVTCIVSVEEFYINIPEISAEYSPSSLGDLKNQMNTPDMVKQYKPSVQAPNYLDLVIVKLNNAHYRGQIVDYDETDYVVYFLDYGYTEQMSRESIYQWFPRWDIVPAQVHRCYFANAQMRRANDKEATMAFRNLILNTGDISAKIMAYTGDLFVQLFDGSNVDIAETLATYGYVTLKDKIIPDSTQVPG